MSVFSEIQLGDVITFQRGFDITKAEQKFGAVPIISSSGFSSFHNVAKAQGPGVIIGRKGTLGTVHFAPGDYWPHDTTLWVKDFKGNDPHFIAYFIKTLRLESFDVGASNPTLNRNHLHKIRVRFPKNPEIQRKIAAILKVYDDLIETNKRRIALLEKMAEEIYREWFVRMRFPGHQNTKFTKGVPENWIAKRLGDILELAYGKALTESEREPGEFHVYGSGGVVGSHSKALVKSKGIIVGRKGNVGAVYFSDRGFFPIDTVFYVVSELPLTYLFFLLKTMSFINNDAAVPGLSRSQAYSNQFYFPEADLIAQFSKVADPIFDLKHRLQAQIEKLTQTRDLLLPRLISGKLSVEDLDIQFPLSMRDDSEADDRLDKTP